MGLGSTGSADILELVTPTTAELLRWWFGEGDSSTRGREFAMKGGDRPSSTCMTAHGGVLRSASLQDLYEQVCAKGMLETACWPRVPSPNMHTPKWCLEMATRHRQDMGAASIARCWQMVDKTAALDEGIDDARFTRRLLVVAPGRITMNAARCLPRQGARWGWGGHGRHRNMKPCGLFLPPARRERVHQFVQANGCAGRERGTTSHRQWRHCADQWTTVGEGGRGNRRARKRGRGGAPRARKPDARVIAAGYCR